MKRLLNFLVAGVLFSSCVNNVEINLEEIPQKGFWSSKPAQDWTQSLLSGNGIMGSMVMGIPYSDTIIVNHALLYRPQNVPLKPVSQGAHLDEIRKMMLSGDLQGASDYVVELSHKEGYGWKIWTDSYIPAFDIVINQKSAFDNRVDGYSRTLDFETGVADVKWSDGEAKYSRETFVSRKDNLIVTRLLSDKDKNINCNITLRERVNKEWWDWIDHRPSKETHNVEIASDGEYIMYSSVFDNQIPDLIRSYGGVSRVINRGGKLTSDNGVVNVTGADEVIILTRVIPDFKDTVPDIERLMSELGRYGDNFDKLLYAHKKIHGEMFNRVEIDLGGDSKNSVLSSEELLESVKGGKYNPTMVEKEFYASRYHLISATGINPPNLQGIWSGTTSSPWSGDYTTNGNLPVVISSMLSSNLPELMLSTFDLMERYIDDFETNAKELFNARGIHVPSRLSSHGLNNHFDATWPMTFWTAGAAWYSMYYYDYYLYTGDIDFLRNRAMPFMEKAALFYEDFLIKGDNGKYVFVPSYSPENNPSNNPSQACINATMDVMAANQLLRNCIAASEVLGINADKIVKWKEMLEDMPSYEINEKGELREWMWPGVEENHTHRHVSHLYGLYDMMDPVIKNDPELREACKKVINERMKIRRQDNGGVMVFGMAQLGCAACNLNESEVAFDILKWISEKYWNTNLFTYHDPGTLFNCDLSGGFQQFIIKMLIYSEPGEIALLPALPKEMSKGSISGLLLRDNIYMNSLEWNGNTVSVRCTPGDNRIVKILLPRDVDTFESVAENQVELKQLSEREFELEMTKNQEVELVFNLVP